MPIHFLRDGTSLAHKKLDDLDLRKLTDQYCTDFTDYPDAQETASPSFTSKGKKNGLKVASHSGFYEYMCLWCVQYTIQMFTK